MAKVAFLGLGVMGFPMARHLAAKGHTVTVYNRTTAKAEAWVKANGGSFATTPRTAASGQDVVFACVGNDDDLRQVTTGPDGAFRTMKPGAVFIDHTTASALVARELHAAAKQKGLGFVDAPVSGGVVGAEQGALTVMVGGDAATLERVQPVLACFGKRIVHCGAVGAGDALKAVNNALLAMHLWGTAEGLVALEKAGVKAEIALDVINTSSGRSNSSMNLFPERVLTRAFPRTFRLALLDKDVGIAAELAREHQVPSPLLQLTAELFRMAHNELGEEADHVEVAKVVERLGGAQIGGSSTNGRPS